MRPTVSAPGFGSRVPGFCATMVGTKASEAREFWNSARVGTLTPWSLAKVWALHTVSETQGFALQHFANAKMVTKVGGGHPSGRSDPAVARAVR